MTLSGVPPTGHGWRWHAPTQEWWLYRAGEVREQVGAEAWEAYRAECERTRGGLPL